MVDALYPRLPISSHCCASDSTHLRDRYHKSIRTPSFASILMSRRPGRVATNETVVLSEAHPPKPRAIEAFENVQQIIKDEILVSRKRWDTHEPRSADNPADSQRANLTLTGSPIILNSNTCDSKLLSFEHSHLVLDTSARLLGCGPVPPRSRMPNLFTSPSKRISLKFALDRLRTGS
jgi:hypothetical protein